MLWKKAQWLICRILVQNPRVSLHITSRLSTHSSTAQASVQSWQRDRWLGLGCGQRHGHRCRPCASDYCLDHELVIAGIVLICFGVVPFLPAFFFQLGRLIKSCKGDCMTQRRKLQMMPMVVIVLIQYLVLGCFRQFCCEWASAVRKQETDF